MVTPWLAAGCVTKMPDKLDFTIRFYFYVGEKSKHHRAGPDDQKGSAAPLIARVLQRSRLESWSCAGAFLFKRRRSWVGEGGTACKRTRGGI